MLERKKKREISAHIKKREEELNKYKRYEIQFARLWSDSVQMLISALEYRAAYIWQDNSDSGLK